MEVISMEDFVLKERDTRKAEVEKDNDAYWDETLIDAHPHYNRMIRYATFLKTPMTWEHFNGPEAIVKIKDVSVLRAIDGHNTANVPHGEINLLFVPDEDNEDWKGTFSVGHTAWFALIAGQPGIELTEYGIKKIFG